MGVIDDLLKKTKEAARKNAKTRAAGKKKKKKASVNKKQEEQKKSFTQTRNIDRVRGSRKTTSAPSSKPEEEKKREASTAAWDKFGRNPEGSGLRESMRPVEEEKRNVDPVALQGNTGRTREELERVATQRELERQVRREEISKPTYNPLVRTPVELRPDTSPEIDNYAEALLRKFMQGAEGSVVGHLDANNANIAEDYLTGDYKKRFVPGVRTGLRMNVEDPELVKKAEEEAKAEGYDSLEEWEVAKANEYMSKNDDYYHRKALLDTDIANQEYGSLGNVGLEISEIIGSMVPSMALGNVSGALVKTLGLTGKMAWALQGIITGGEIADRVSGTEAKYIYDRLAEEKRKTRSEDVTIEDYRDMIGKAKTVGELIGIAEAGTEMLFGGLTFLGKGLLDDTVAKVGWKLINEPTKEAINAWRNTTSGHIISEVVNRMNGAIGEGMEEAIMSIAQPAIEKQVAGIESEVTLSDIARDFGLGAAVSLVVGIPVTAVDAIDTAMGASSEKKAKGEFIKAWEDRLNNLVDAGDISKEDANNALAEAKDLFEGKGSLNVSDAVPEEKVAGEALDTVYDTYEEAKKAMMQEARTKKDGEKITANYIDNGVVKTFTTTAKGGTLGLGRSTEAGKEYQRIAQAKNVTERSGYQLNVKEEIIKEVSSLSKAIGREVEFYRNDDATDHGYMDKKTGKIYINAGSSQSAARSVIAHELTHQMENTAGWSKLVELMKKHYGSSYESRRQERIDAYEAFGKPLKVDETRKTYDEADQELVAMFVEEKLLTDAETIREVVNTDKTLAQKIIAWINKVIQKLAGSKEQKMLVEARDLWNQALQEEQSGKVKPRTIEEEVTDDAGVEVRSSIGKNDKLMSNAEKRNKTTQAVSEEVLEEARKVREEIKEAYQHLFIADNMSERKSPLVGNDSYSGSLDNTTICTRSLTMESIVELVAQRIGRPLRNEEAIVVAQELMEYTGDRAECLYCYQANAKRGFEDALANFIDQRNTVIENHLNGMDKDTNYKLMLDYNFETGKWGKQSNDSTKERFETFIKIAEGKIPKAGALYMANTRVLNENLKDPKVPDVIKNQLKQARKYAQGAVKAHGRVYYAVYNGQILRVSEKKVAEWNNTYGLRMYSFSDFSPAFILENMQMITDASVRGLKMLAYTKEAEFVEIFGNTGMAINISVAGVSDGQGGYHSDGMQGMNWENAKALRDKYPAAGTVYVAKNDAEVEWAMAQDWIDTVIPFHISYGSGMMQRSMGWKNYSSQQSEKKQKDWDGEKGDKKTIYPSAHQNDKETYLRLCEENKLTPKFSQWVDNPNYMKLVNETRLAPNEMNPVEPRFDLDAAKATLDQFAKNGGYNPVLGGTQENREYIADEITEKVKKRAPEVKAQDRRFSVGAPDHRVTKADVSYEALIAKPDMVLTVLTEDVPLKDSGQIDRSKVKKIAKINAKKKGHKNNTDRQTFVKLKDLNLDVLLTTDGIEHGLTRNKYTAQTTLKIADILENAIVVNELDSRYDEKFSYVCLGAGIDLDGNLYPVKFIINVMNYNVGEIADIVVYDKLYSVNAKKEMIPVRGSTSPNGDTRPSHRNHPMISIAELLDIVKNSYSDILSDDIYNYYGIERVLEKMDDLRYSIGSSTDAEYIEAVNRGDMTTAQRLVREAANIAGFTSPKLHHGTKSFGFTQLRTKDLDIFEWSPFFATSDPNLAETYSGETARRQIRYKKESSRPIVDFPIASEEQKDKYMNDFRLVFKMRRREVNNYLNKPLLMRNKKTNLFKRYVAEIQNMIDAKSLDDLLNSYKSLQNVIDDLESGFLNAAERKLVDIDNVTDAVHDMEVVFSEEMYISPEGDVITLQEKENIEEEIRKEIEQEEFLKAMDEISDDGEKRGIYSFYANLDGLLEIDGEGKNWNHIDGSKIGKEGYAKTRDVALYARDNGYKGVIIKNIYDSGGQTGYYEPGDIYIFFEPASQVKSADTVTYDDNNEVIPLSERFNEENNDIRWSVGYYEAKYKKGDKFHWLGEAVTVDEVLKERGFPDTYILRYEDGSTDAVKGDELMSDEDVEKYNAKKGNAVFGEDVVEYRVGERVTLGFGEKGYIKDKYRMSGSEYAYTVDLDNGDTMTHITADDIVNHMRDIKHINDGYVPPARKSKAKIEISKNYLVGDTVSYLNERASIVERNNPKGGTLTYTLELDNGDRVEVTADQLQVGVTPELHFDELPKEEQEAWHEPPADWDEAYEYIDDLEPPGKPSKESPMELPEVRHMLSDYSDMLSDPTEEEIEFEWAWTKNLTGSGVSFLKDYVRNIEAAAHGNKDLERRLRDTFVKPFRKGKSKYVSGVHAMLDELYVKMEELGIKKESPESAAIIKFGEKKVTEWVRVKDLLTGKYVFTSTTKPYTLEDLKKEFPENWENIVEADRWMRDKYDKYLVAINEVRREIYGHHFKHREMEISTAREKANQHEESRHALESQLFDIEQCLRAKRTQLAVKRQKQNAAVLELEREIDYNATYRNTIIALIEEHKEKEDHYRQVAEELEHDLLHGESWNQKRLKARENYYHHMREESGFLEDLFMNGRNSEIDPALEGKSVSTKPKARWSGIFERQGRDPFKYCGISAMIDYIQAAEYAVHMDPVISQFRADIQNMAVATEESRNCNKLILWLTNWTNDLSGKTTDHFDRFIQERIGRDNMRKIRKVVSRAKFNAVGLNLNSAIAQFGNLPNALAYVQNPESWGKGLLLYKKWLFKDDDARTIVNQSTFLDERYLDTLLSKFDQRLKDKPEQFAAWVLRFGDKHSSFMIWCVAYEDAVRKGLRNPVAVADEIAMESVAGRGVGEIPLQMRSTWTQIIAPFQIEVNNAYQIYKKKTKTLLSKRSRKDERIDAGTSFLLVLLGNFVMNTIFDALAHQRILFDPIYVLLETIGEWADEDDLPEDEQTNWFDKFRDLLGREIGNVFSNMPYGDLLAYYIFNNEWARENLFGDYDPTRFGVGNIPLDWLANFVTDLKTGDDIADDIRGFLTTFVTPFGGKQIERILDGFVHAGWLPDIDISLSEGISIERQKAPGVYNRKDQLLFPVPTFADDPWGALRAIFFGAYSTEYGEKYLGKDRENSKWWENILGWNKIKEQTALSERATAVYNALVADGADQFAIYDTLRNVQNADKTVDKRNVLLDALAEGTITEEDALNILLGYMTQKNNVESVNKKITAFTDAGLSVTDYLEVSNLYTMIDNNEEYATAQDRANAFVTELVNAGYTADQINDINDVMKYFSHIPANIDKFAEMTASGLDPTIATEVQNALAALEPLEGETNVSATQKAEAIANLNLSSEDELAAMSLALPAETYVKYKVVTDYGVNAQTWVDLQNALDYANANNPDESKRNKSFDKEEKKAALDSLDVSNETRAALWQILDNQLYSTDPKHNTAWKAGRNPYSSSVGAQVVDACVEGKSALEASKETNETESAYTSPVSGDIVINSEYGYRIHPISGKWKMHDGLDIDGEQGDPVFAAAEGTVVKAVHSDTGYGNHVIIEHADGTQTLYAHMYSYGVEEGQTVSQGEQIGEVGSTGGTTGPHLHFEVRVDGQSVNPQTIFDFTGEGIVTESDPNYAPIVSGGGSSGGSSSGGSSRSGSTASVGSRTSEVASNRRSGGLTLPSVGGSGGNGGGSRASTPVAGMSTSAPTFGARGLYLPKASDYTPNRRSISSSVATTQRTGRTGGSFWDDNILS